MVMTWAHCFNRQTKEIVANSTPPFWSQWQVKKNWATKLATKVTNLVPCVRRLCAKVYKVPLSACVNGLSKLN